MDLLRGLFTLEGFALCGVDDGQACGKALWRFFKGVEGVEWPTLHRVKLITLRGEEIETLEQGAKVFWGRMVRCVEESVPPDAERIVEESEVEDASLEYYMTFEGFVEVLVTVIPPWVDTRPFADE